MRHGLEILDLRDAVLVYEQVAETRQSLQVLYLLDLVVRDLQYLQMRPRTDVLDLRQSRPTFLMRLEQR